MKRYDSIEVLRAAAILLMVQVHFTLNLSAERLASGGVLHHLSLFLGNFPAPLFTFVAGMSLRLSLAHRPGDAARGAHHDLGTVRRGILLFFFGFVFATLVALPDQVFNWDILPLLGFSILVLLALRRLPAPALAATAVAILLASPLLRGASGYASHWVDGNKYRYAFTLGDVAWGFVANGYFPLFPWLVFPLAGFLAARILLPDALTLRRRLPAVGLALVALAVAGERAGRQAGGFWRGYASPYLFYPATTTFVLMVLGLIICAFWLLHLRLDLRQSPATPLLPVLRRFSRYSLTIYVVHYAAHLWPLQLAARMDGQTDPRHYYSAVMSTRSALLLSCLFVAACYPALAAWDRRGGRYSFEWVLRKLAG